jgi:arylsulfatase A-like enzyme
MLCYEELVHIPLIVCHPDAVPGRRQALTVTIDIMPIVLDLHGATNVPGAVMGKSVANLLMEDAGHHEGILYGYFGREVNMIDGKYTYHRMPISGSTCDYHFTDLHLAESDAAKQAESGTHLPHCKAIPHFRIAQESRIPAGSDGRHVVFDLENDPKQSTPIYDDELENELVRKLAQLLRQAEAPESQFARPGVA